MRMTVSNMGDLERCETLGYNRVVKGYFPSWVADPLFLGTVVHKALEMKLEGRGTAACDTYIQKKVDERVQLSASPYFQFSKPTDQELLGVMGKAMVQNFPWRYESVEQVFQLPKDRLPVVSPFDFSGKIDGMDTLEDGQRYLVDVKTAADMRPFTNLDVLRMNAQAVGYVAAHNILGGTNFAQGLSFLIILKAQIRQRKNEELGEFALRMANDYAERGMTKPYYVRVDVPVTVQDESRFWLNFEKKSRLLDSFIRDVNHRPDQNWSACFDVKRGVCPFLEACANEKLPSTISGMVCHGIDYHPELDEPEE